MKRLIKISIFFLGFILNGLAYAQMYGPLVTQTESASGRIDTDQTMFVVDQAAYTPGGITFTYPVGVFSVAPCVFVAATVPSAIVNTEFVATVSGNSATGVTITVYQVAAILTTPTLMIEATLLDNVMVCVFALGR